jgi:nucleoside-diphosphate-sugar epimerase
MQAFVTGASGFIGTHLVRRLVAGGWRVLALDLATPLSPAPGIEVVRGDVRDPGPWKKALAGTDVLFHLAAVLGASRLSGESFLEINAGGTETVLGAAREAGIGKTICVSSAGVIGAVKPGAIADEDTPPNPRNAYDRSKLEAERVALEFARRGTEVVVVRPGWVYGPGDRRTFKVIKAVNDRRFALVAPDRGRQTPVFIDDLVDGLLQAAERGRRGEIYHLTGDEVLTVRRMAAILAEACGVSAPRLRIPVLPARVAAWALEKAYAPFGKEAPLNRSRLAFFLDPKALSNAKARRELGFRPEVDFRTGTARAVAWYRQQGWL